MKIFDTLIQENADTAVALGFFDGVHLGHRDVLTLAAAQKSRGLTPVCFTFSQSPKAVIGGEGEYIMTRRDKEKTLEALGIEHAFFADFRSLMHLSARDFAERILFGTLRAKKLFCGCNYHFGERAEGDAAMLEALCRRHGAELFVLPLRESDGETVCSTRIKRLLKDGRVAEANGLLCARFGFRGEIVHGKRLGRELGTPTLNMTSPEGFLLPKYGVYASEVTLESSERFCGVTNVGIKPTVNGTAPIWETWMPDYRGGELYGQSADIRLIEFIRPEKKFSSLDELKRNIIENGETAKRIYATK